MADVRDLKVETFDNIYSHSHNQINSDKDDIKMAQELFDLTNANVSTQPQPSSHNNQGDIDDMKQTATTDTNATTVVYNESKNLNVETRL